MTDTGGIFLVFSISCLIAAGIIYFRIHLETEREISASIKRNDELMRNAFISIAKKYIIKDEQGRQDKQDKQINPLEQKLTSLGKRRL